MKSHLRLVPTLDMTREDWLAYRHQGLGASEVGIVLGMDDYTSSLELFHHKIGTTRKFDVEGISQFMGREHEDMIANLWQYWGGDEESMIQNFRSGNLVRKCQRVNAYVHNPEYPWLFVSLDRKINKQGDKGEGTLELKQISGFEADKWDAGIPPKYVLQVQTQMMVCEFLWGEMALLQDGRRMLVLPFDRSELIMEHIVKKTKDFWDRVLAARKLVNERYLAEQNFNMKRIQEIDAEIDNLAPEPDGTIAYSDYLSDKYNRPRYADRQGTIIELEQATQHLKLNHDIKELQERKRHLENSLKHSMKDYQVLDFGLDGKIYWASSEGRPRTFRNKLKVDVSTISTAPSEQPADPL